MVEHDETTKVGHDRNETVINNETVTIGVDRTETVGGNETVTIGGAKIDTVTGVYRQWVKNDLSIKVDGQTAHLSVGPHAIDAEVITLSAKTAIVLEVGGSRITIEAAHITIVSARVDINE